MQVSKVAPGGPAPFLMHRRMEETFTFVGLDVHKKDISVAVAAGGLRGEARFGGVIPNTAAALSKLAGKLAGKGGADPLVDVGCFSSFGHGYPAPAKGPVGDPGGENNMLCIMWEHFLPPSRR